MKTVLFVVSFFAAFSVAQAATRPAPQKVDASALKFTYQTYDAETHYVCEHALLSDTSPYDWKVKCFDGTKLTHEFTAHVALSLYPHPGGNPELSIEMLYWLTGTGLESEVGVTSWTHLAKKTAVSGMSASLTIDHGTAGLYLDIDPSKAASLR